MDKTAEQMAEGWIAHDGGKMPVSGDTRVVVKHRSGETSDTYLDQYNFDDRAICWAWQHMGHPGDIVAYRLQAQEQSNAD